MIELNIDNPEVLRRVLTEMEESIPDLGGLLPMAPLDGTANTDEIILKINEIILNFNILLNKDMI